MRVHTNDKPFSCSLCGKKFRSNNHLESHLLVYSAERNHACEKCSSKFKTRSNLIQHIKTHEIQQSSKCEKCFKNFIGEEHLRIHIQRIHRHRERQHFWVFCSTEFHKSKDLQIHIRSHTKEKPYSSKICLKGFFEVTGLYSHIRRGHTNEKYYSCESCKEAFVTMAELVAHRIKKHSVR